MNEPIGIDAGGTLIALDRSGQSPPMRADQSTGRWSTLDGFPLPHGPDSAAVWTGTALFVWGGLPSDTPATFQDPSPNSPDAALYTP